ncbi:hypothetical protein BC831DRAFT_514100 [Entophlyctis helioformis]|nr:hypothetical protein BC831DRAFT_514100 [Entophlyctis helioformis]
MATLSALLVLLAGLLRSAHAQAAEQCFLLSRDTPCGDDYSGFPIQTAAFANQAEFTSVLQTGIADLDNVAKAFISSYGCSAATVRPALDSMRFQVSHSCSNFVNEALKAGCRPSPAQPNKNPILCQERCDFATSTLMMVLGNATACPPASAEIMTRRSNAVNRFDTYCKAMGPQGVNACTLGAVNERDLCGTSQ